MFHVKPLTINKLIFVFVGFIKGIFVLLTLYLEVFIYLYLLFNCYLSLCFSEREIINTTIKIVFLNYLFFCCSLLLLFLINQFLLINIIFTKYLMFVFLKKKLFFEKFDLKKWKINKKSRGAGVEKEGENSLP